jgi:chromosomal replication initiation ATPase DnaA
MTIETIPAAEVTQKVCKYFDITTLDILQSQYEPQKVWHRQVHVYMLHLFTDLKHYQIGVASGYTKDAINYAVNAVKNKCLADPKARKQVIEIESLFE